MIRKNDKELFSAYLTDSSNFRGDASFLLIPENEDELSDAVRYCYSNNIPFTVSGAGTGLCGGRVPLSGAVISTEKLTYISDYNPETNTISVQAGAMFSDLEDILSRSGLFIPSNPTEKNSTVGGNIANNSSGAKSFKYGPYRNFVKSINVVLSDGSWRRIERGKEFLSNNSIVFEFKDGTRELRFKAPEYPRVKNASGFYFGNNFDLIDLFIGAEGSLGIISSAELMPLKKVENILGGIIFFEDEIRLLDFVSALRSKSLASFSTDITIIQDVSSRLIEFFDSNSLNIIRNKFPLIPADAIGAVWIEQEYNSIYEDMLFTKWYEFISNYSALADDAWISVSETDHRKMEEFRHALPAAIFEKFTAHGTSKIGTDSAVPVESFNTFYLSVKKLLIASGLEFYIWGHFGDCHIHANIISYNDEQYTQGMMIYDEIIEMALAFRGTVSAEHGIGKLKRKYLLQMYGEEVINEMRKIKEFFDPKMLLNQGNLFL